MGDPEILRARIKEMLDDAEREALRAGGAPDEIQKAKFAVVAFIDETILSSDWPQKEQWVNTPLQLEIYDRYDAGEVFFDHLETFLGAAERHAEVLEVYYLCMALGFKGKYRIHQQEKRRELVETTSDALARIHDQKTEELSPHGMLRDSGPTELSRTIPTWVIGAAALALATLVYAGMYLYISASAQETASTIQQMIAG